MSKGLWLICYDVHEQRRRYRIDKRLLDAGTRVQRSVFEAHLTEPEQRRLRADLRRFIDPARDSVRFYPLCRRCSTDQGLMWLGNGPRDEDVHYYVF